MRITELCFLVALCVAPVLGLISTNLLLPAFPYFAADGLDTRYLNFGVSLFLLSFAVSQLLSGIFIRMNSVRIIVVCALCFAAIAPIIYFAGGPSGISFVSMRVALGLAFGVVVVGARFFISRLEIPAWRSRGFALSQMAFSAFPILATLVAVPTINRIGVGSLLIIPALLSVILALTLLFCSPPQIDWSRNSPRSLKVQKLDWGVAASSSTVYSILYGALVWIANLPDVSDRMRVTMFAMASVMAILGSGFVWLSSARHSQLYPAFVFVTFGSSLLFFYNPVLGLAAVSFAVGGVMPLSLGLFLDSAKGTTALPVSIIGSLHLVGGFVGSGIVQLVTEYSYEPFAVFTAVSGTAALVAVLSRRDLHTIA